MNDLEFTFERSIWEEAIDALNPGDGISATRFLTLVESADETETENALDMLAQRHISLDVTGLPKVASTGTTAQRLQLEERLVKTGQLPGGLDQNDPLRLYLEEIAGIPAAGDLEVLAEQLAQGNDTVITSLVNLMLSRVVETAKEYMGRGVYLLDLIQEASLGLWQGIQDYTGGDFEEHCMWWIRQFLAGAVTLQARSAGIGQRMRQAAEDYRAVDERLLAELGRNPTTEEIAEGLHMSPEETEVVAEMLESARLLQRVRQPEPEQLPQEEDQAVEDTAYFRMRQRIEELLSDLSEEDARLLSLRYGLEGGLPMDAVQVAAQLGLTPQEVNNREAAALAKLRSNNERGN